MQALMSEQPDWLASFAAAESLTQAGVEALLRKHGARGRRAIEGVAENRVKQYRDFTVVVGHEGEYIVEGDSCTCADTRYNLSADNPAERCWHRLAVDIAHAVDTVDEFDLYYGDVASLL